MLMKYTTWFYYIQVLGLPLLLKHSLAICYPPSSVFCGFGLDEVVQAACRQRVDGMPPFPLGCGLGWEEGLHMLHRRGDTIAGT